MKATKDLIEEHESIASFLAIMDAILSNMRSGKRISLEDLQWLLEFNRDFILKCHLGKEDCVFFPSIENVTIPQESINFFGEEHEAAWKIAKAMREFIQDFIEGRTDSCSDPKGDAILLMTSYVDLMKNHIDKEEKILFPLVDEYISIDLDERLAYRFRLFIEERIGIGRYMDLQEQLSDIRSFYGI